MSIVPWMKGPTVSFQRRSNAWISRQYLGKRVMSLAVPSAKVSPASNSRFQSGVQMVSWNHCASSSVSKSLRNSSIGSHSTKTLARSKTGMGGVSDIAASSDVRGRYATEVSGRTGGRRNGGDLRDDGGGIAVARQEIVDVLEGHGGL